MSQSCAAGGDRCHLMKKKLVAVVAGALLALSATALFGCSSAEEQPTGDNVLVLTRVIRLMDMLAPMVSLPALTLILRRRFATKTVGRWSLSRLTGTRKTFCLRVVPLIASGTVLPLKGVKTNIRFQIRICSMSKSL